MYKIYKLWTMKMDNKNKLILFDNQNIIIKLSQYQK